MKKTINLLVTLTVLVFATQFYVLKPETTLAQVDAGSDTEADGNASEEFFDRGDAEMERESQNLESGNNEINREELNREQLNRLDDEGQNRARTEEERLNQQREQLDSNGETNRQDRNVDGQLESEADSFDKTKE